MGASSEPTITIRLARETDVPALASMVDDFVRGHKAQDHPRPIEALGNAYFGPHPVAEVVVAERDGDVIGMVQWAQIYDMFWAKLGGQVDWLYVRPRWRGLGVSVAMLAQVCGRVREGGGSFVRGAASDTTAPLYLRSAAGGHEFEEFHLSAAAFQRVADLAGKPVRDVVRGLPDPKLNFTPPA